MAMGNGGPAAPAKLPSPALIMAESWAEAAAEALAEREAEAAALAAAAMLAEALADKPKAALALAEALTLAPKLAEALAAAFALRAPSKPPSCKPAPGENRLGPKLASMASKAESSFKASPSKARDNRAFRSGMPDIAEPMPPKAAAVRL